MSTFAKVVRMVVLTLQVAVSVNEEKTSLGFGIDIKKSDNDHITGYERKKHMIKMWFGEVIVAMTLFTRTEFIDIPWNGCKPV